MSVEFLQSVDQKLDRAKEITDRIRKKARSRLSVAIRKIGKMRIRAKKGIRKLFKSIDAKSINLVYLIVLFCLLVASFYYEKLDTFIRLMALIGVLAAIVYYLRSAKINRKQTNPVRMKSKKRLHYSGSVPLRIRNKMHK